MSLSVPQFEALVTIWRDRGHHALPGATLGALRDRELVTARPDQDLGRGFTWSANWQLTDAGAKALEAERGAA